MFLRRYTRNKDGNTHTYYALVESARTEAGPRQHVVAYLGELNRDEYRCPIQWAGDFLARRRSTAVPQSSYPRGLVAADMAELVPPLIDKALRQGLPIMDKRWHGRFLPEATLVGPEARGSAPVRIERGEQSRESPGVEGLYPVGEGAGYAGGILSAGVDGIKIAEAVAQAIVAGR